MNEQFKIAIASGKGGTGKTTFAVNLFHLLAKEKNVALVDCDVEEPNSKLFYDCDIVNTVEVNIKVPKIDTSRCVYCGKCVEYCAFNAIIYVKSISYLKLMEDLCHGCGACSIACNKGAIKEKEKELGKVHIYKTEHNSHIIEGNLNIGIATAVPIINKAIEASKEYPIVILDAPPGTSCPAVATVSESDYVILIAEPTPFGLNDLKLSVEAFSKMQKKIGVVINKSGLNYNEMQDFLSLENIPILGEIPFEKKIAKILSEGKILIEEYPEMNNIFSSVMNIVFESCNK